MFLSVTDSNMIEEIMHPEKFIERLTFYLRITNNF